jgi:hypothetical protein
MYSNETCLHIFFKYVLYCLADIIGFDVQFLYKSTVAQLRLQIPHCIIIEIIVSEFS